MFNLLINLLIGPVHCSRNTLNGDLASATIPEESRLMAKKKSELEDPLSSFSSWGNRNVQLPLSIAMQKLLWLNYVIGSSFSLRISLHFIEYCKTNKKPTNLWSVFYLYIVYLQEYFPNNFTVWMCIFFSF